ncbi:MAG: hypothetical protein O7B35_15260 [Deltaproteobacteria bacterium]|nr:hypothetical protein [Deltaproteobacteria bacterium]
MSKKTFCFALCAMLLALSFLAQAQKAGKVSRIGTLMNGSPATHGHNLEWYRQGF